MNNGRKNRARLWLRAEKAMGLKSVPVKIIETSNVESTQGSGVTGQGSARNPESETRNPITQSSVLSPQSFFDGPINSPVLPREEKILRLREMDEKEVRGCNRCRLCQKRTHTVFGEGDPDAKIFFIGEGPGENEDLTGRPFVGRAGELLDKMIVGMGLQRQQVYIGNIVKCRPPDNRAPVPDETQTCTPYLQRQIEIIRPRVIVTLGLPASQFVLQSKESMGRLRGHWHEYRGIKVMPTYHPAYILRNYTEQTRRAVWSDLQQVMVEIGLPLTKRDDNG